jgi:peptidoglycan hydrolase-like protein with peptidoglycan-binding domain
MAKTQRFLSAPVGYGFDNQKQDIAAAKQKLRDLGFYAPRDTGMGDDFDAGFDAAIQDFQARAGLRVDGVMNPGGETERNIEAYRTGEGFAPLPQPVEMQVKGSVGAGGANAPEDVVAAKRALAASGRYGHDRTRPPSPYTD